VQLFTLTESIKDMPRSFLITKLHKWKDSGAIEDGMVCGDDVHVTDACDERIDDEDQMVQVEDFSTEGDNFTANIDAVSDNSDDENCLADFNGTS